MSEAPTPSTSQPPAPKSPNHPSNILRNILVGAITTIIGSTAVYFITNRNKNSNSEMEVMLMTKDATINAWKSYVTFENAYTKKDLSLLNDLQARTMNWDEFVAESGRESNKFKKGLEELKTKKNIDKDFIQALDSRLDNEKSTTPILQKYSRFLKSMADTNLTADEKMKALQTEGAKWEAQAKGFTERALTDIEDIAKTLSERYGQTFAMTDFLIYNMLKNQKDSAVTVINKPAPSDPDSKPTKTDTAANIKEVPATTQLLTGRWLANPPNGADIDLQKKGKFFWHVSTNGDHISGTWKLIKNKLNLYPVNDETGKKGLWTFDLTLVRPNTFSMKLTVEPHNNYNMVRQAPKQ
jgi:hypothetical protein